LARFFAGGSDDRTPRRRWIDRILGIVIGLVLGLGVLVYFVFVHSEGAIDAPSINGAESGKTTGSTGESGALPAEGTPPAHPGSPEEPAEEGSKSGPGSKSGQGTKTKPVLVVKVIGGAPPVGAGPKELHFKKGEKVRFEIDTDEPFSFEIKGLGVSESIETNSIISFKAKKAGQFPVIATATLIGVADLLVKK
jgi:hypothetical protein